MSKWFYLEIGRFCTLEAMAVDSVSVYIGTTKVHIGFLINVGIKSFVNILTKDGACTEIEKDWIPLNSQKQFPHCCPL